MVSHLDYSKQFDQLAQDLHHTEKYEMSYIFLAENESIIYDSLKKVKIDVLFYQVLFLISSKKSLSP